MQEQFILRLRYFLLTILLFSGMPSLLRARTFALQDPPPEYWCFSRLTVIIVLLLLILLVTGIYFFLRNQFAAKKQRLEQLLSIRAANLIAEKDKTDALLANVLPKTTAEEIKSTGKAAKVKYNFVTVLFSDIQGFTRIAEEMNPEVLIDELDKFFFHFDSVVDKYKIEKIKTIGDAYMCAGGIPEKDRANPVKVILAAMEMQNYMGKLKAESVSGGSKYWDIRIGIHTGTVIAGVVGQKKLSYDIWGDTVNTASRMESSGEPGKINISGTTYEFVKDFFDCKHRGRMPVKYKGEVDMYFVEGIVPELRNESGLPNDMFLFRMQLIRLEDVEEAVIRLFTDDAPPNLYFHNLPMAKSIVAQVELICRSEQVPEKTFFVLKLASLFLITGYITDYENPEAASLSFMDEILPRYGLDAELVNESRLLIRNSYNEIYNTMADRILHDARYEYLGRNDYIRLSDRLLKERTEHGLEIGKEGWEETQKQLLERHEFLTKTARLLRSVSIQEQTDALKAHNK